MGLHLNSILPQKYVDYQLSQCYQAHLKILVFTLLKPLNAFGPERPPFLVCSIWWLKRMVFPLLVEDVRSDLYTFLGTS